MTDHQIIDLYFQRSETAISATENIYGAYCRSIAARILQNKEDAREVVNDTYWKVWNSIPPNDPQNLPAYICKIARRIGIDRFRYLSRKKRDNGYTLSLSELEECLPDAGSLIHAEDDSTAIRLALSAFVRQLDPETRVLFVRRYVYLESVASLASRFHLKENHIAVKLYRARKKLKKVLRGICDC